MHQASSGTLNPKPHLQRALVLQLGLGGLRQQLLLRQRLHLWRVCALGPPPGHLHSVQPSTVAQAGNDCDQQPTFPILLCRSAHALLHSRDISTISAFCSLMLGALAVKTGCCHSGFDSSQQARAICACAASR